MFNLRPIMLFAPDGDPIGGDPLPDGDPVAADTESGSGEVVPEERPPASPDPVTDPFADYGGVETVRAAHQLYEALGTEEGVIQLFVEAGRSLGVPPERLQTLFGGGEDEGSEPSYDDADDDLDLPLTKREVLDLLREQVHAPLAQQREYELQAQASHTINSTLDTLGVTDPADRAIVLALGDEFIDQNSIYDPKALEAAVRKGHEQFLLRAQAAAEQRVREKAQQAASVPAPLTGGSTAGGEEPEPLSYEKYGNDVMREAFRRARQRLQA